MAIRSALFILVAVVASLILPWSAAPSHAEDPPEGKAEVVPAVYLFPGIDPGGSFYHLPIGNEIRMMEVAGLAGLAAQGLPGDVGLPFGNGKAVAVKEGRPGSQGGLALAGLPAALAGRRPSLPPGGQAGKTPEDPVPESSTLIMIGLGLMAIAWVGRKLKGAA